MLITVSTAESKLVRHLFAKYDYPPDLDEKAVELVPEQAESFAVGAAE